MKYALLAIGIVMAAMVGAATAASFSNSADAKASFAASAAMRSSNLEGNITSITWTSKKICTIWYEGETKNTTICQACFDYSYRDSEDSKKLITGHECINLKPDSTSQSSDNAEALSWVKDKMAENYPIENGIVNYFEKDMTGVRAK